MAYKKTVILIAAALILISLSGCLDSSRKEAVQHRWEKTLDQARVVEARQSLEKGQWAYAQRVLEDCTACFDPGSSLSGEAQQILAKIQTDSSRDVKAVGESQMPKDMVY